MPTSNSFNFELNRDQVIKGALRLLGVISQGQTPDADQINDAAEALNVLVKAWAAEGLPLWAIKQASFTPVAGTSDYTIGIGKTIVTEEPLKLYQGWYRNTTSLIDVPLILITQSRFNSLSAKSQQGTTTQIYYERLNGSGIIHLYLTPDATFAANNTVHLLFQRPFADFDASTDTPDFPQEWIRALKYGLADEMSMEYGLGNKDRVELKARADEYRLEALGFTQEEGSMYFSPNNNQGKR
jgi:hypothetical protein